jgi:DNA-binding MarR family transcriptional regulator
MMLVPWEHEVQTVEALGARLYFGSSTMTPLLKRMEAARLVVRARDPNEIGDV